MFNDNDVTHALSSAGQSRAMKLSLCERKEWCSVEGEVCVRCDYIYI
jgi:hypothetical protein